MIEDSETETGVTEAENTEEPCGRTQRTTEDSEYSRYRRTSRSKEKASAKNNQKENTNSEKVGDTMIYASIEDIWKRKGTDISDTDYVTALLEDAADYH